MKTKSLFIAAVVVFISAVAFAGKDEPRKTGLAVVPVKGSEIFKVIYKGESFGKVKLNIYNATGTMILSQTMNGVDGFICPVNFTGLTSGEYTIELIDATGKKVEKVVYAPQQNIKRVNVSRIANEENKYILSIANSGSEFINLKIYDSNENLIHEESKTIDGNFAQVYKLTDKSSSHTFQVTDNAGNTKTIKF